MSLTYEYIYNGSILAGVTWLNYAITYMYDNNGDIFGYNLDGANYYYIKNAQNDVTAITKEDGTIICRYYYDAWGNMNEEQLSTNVDDSFAISNNHITYRSYFYDSEINMYYLNSRYYSPDLCRFLNADSVVSGVGGDICGNNLFTYCHNNPVNMSDENGNWPKWVKKAVSTISTAVKKVVSSVKSIVSPSKKSGVVRVSTNSLPKTGDPGSSRTRPNPDGTPKQKRWYGPDGNAERDRDYNHPGDVPFPHDHEWKDGKRQKDHLPPSPDYEFSLEPVIGIALVTICTVGIIAVAADDLTGIGVADDFLFGPLGTGFAGGLTMIFG